MKRTLDKTKALIEFFANRKHLRTLTVTLAAIVVFVTTYVLILPAFTLEQDEAAKMGGIDIAVEQSVDEAEGIDLKDDVSDKTVKDDAVPAPPEENGVGQQTAYLDNATLEFEGDGFAVSAKVDEDARLPEDTKLSAEELDKGTKDFEYGKYYDDALAALRKDSGDNSYISFIRFYDISLMSDGETVKPEAPVNVSIAYDDAVKTGDAEDIRIVEFADDEKTGETEAVLLDDKDNVETTVKKDGLREASFDAEDPSIYAVVGTKTETIEKEVITAKGETYTITAEYDPEATGIPEGADLKVREITGDEADPYAVAAANKLDVNVDDISFARFFDITIVDEEGKEYHDLGDAVQLSIRYKSAVELGEGQELNVVHFKDGLDEEPELIDSDLSKDGKEVTFEQNGFSVTATVLTDVTELASGQYVIYTRVKQSDNSYKYYALSRFEGNNRTADTVGTDGGRGEGVYPREITVEGNTVTYSGTQEDILWTVAKSGNYYRIYYGDGHEPENNRFLMHYYHSINIASRAENSDAWNGHSGDNEQGLDWTYNFTNHTLYNRRGATYLRFTGTMFDYGSSMEIFFASAVTASCTSTDWSKPTIKYVDGDGNVIATESSITGYRSWSLHQRNAYVIYDIDGYTYVKTQIDDYGDSGTEIIPALEYGGAGSWFYCNSNLGADPEYNTGIWLSEQWQDLGNKTVYVIYKKTPEPVEGGTPVAHTEGNRDPAPPTIHKGSVSNGDGTNTLSLEITADTAEQKVYKLADVIVILDVSSSMSRKMGSDQEATTAPAEDSRETVAKRTIRSVAETLIGEGTNYVVENEHGQPQKQIRMALISFDYESHILQDFTDDYSTFSTAVGRATKHVGTNWEAALNEANYLSVDPERATFVIFVTDGNPSLRVTRGNLLTYNESDVTYKPYSKFVDDEHVDVIAERTYKFLKAKGYYGDQKETDVRNFYSAIASATSIVDHNKNLYAIGIGMKGSVSRLEKLMKYAYGDDYNAKYFMESDSADSLQQAFDQIVADIASLKGFGDIKMFDGLTDLSSTVMEKSSLLGVSDDFEYWIAPAPDGWDTWTDEQKAAYRPEESDFEVWPEEQRVREGCKNAAYDSTRNAVVWNMGSRFMPQAGYTYRVTFKVWPNQDAYDLISDLNNGVKNYDDLPENIRNQINENITVVDGQEIKTYTLNTNRDDAYTTYRTAEKTGSVVTPSGNPVTLNFNDVPPMPLTKTQMGIKKYWNDSAFSTNRPGYIYLAVLRDGAGIYADALPSDAVQQEDENIYYSAANDCYYYKTTVSGTTKYQYVVKLSDPDWSATTFISPGLKVSLEEGADPTVLEPGHDYTFHELPDDYHYELNGDPVHPMLINSDSTIYDNQTGTAIVNFEVTNDLRGGIEVKKKVVDSDGNDISDQEGVKDTEFTFTVTRLVSADGSDIWYSKYDADGTQIDLAPSDPDTMSAIIAQGDTFTLKPGQYIRLLNVPIGTSCLIEETDPSSFGYKQHSIIQSENDTVKITDIIGVTERITANIIRKTVANVNYQILFVNKPNFEVEVEKVDASDSTKKLAGVDFALFTDSACTQYATDPSGNYYGTEKEINGVLMHVLTTDANGKIQLGVLPVGTYYLKEVATQSGYILPESPIVITVAGTGVTATQGGRPLVVNHNSTNTLYTIVAVNSAGTALPHTGGTGTTPYTLGGIALLLAAAMMYGLRLRRRERRSE